MKELQAEHENEGVYLAEMQEYFRNDNIALRVVRCFVPALVIIGLVLMTNYSLLLSVAAISIFAMCYLMHKQRREILAIAKRYNQY